MFLAELYVPGRDVATVLGRVEEATCAVASSGISIALARSLIVSADELCYFVFDTRSAAAVHEVAHRADVAFERISEAVEA